MASGKRQKIGNKYYLGLHLVPFEKIDAIVEIIAAKKSLWRGWWTGGRLNINRPEHMGGDEKEGGISGGFDLLTGGITQTVNDYLDRLYTLGGSIASAYRGVVSIVLRQPYIGANTGRLPELAFKAINIEEVVGGWKEDKALGNIDYNSTKVSYYVAVDVSLSANFSAADRNFPLATFLLSLKGAKHNVRLVAMAGSIYDSIEIRGCTDADYDTLANWATSLPGGPGPVEAFNYATAATDAKAFFTKADSGSVFGQLTAIVGLPPLTNPFNRGSVAPDTQKVMIYLVRGEPTDYPATGNITAARATLDSAGTVPTHIVHIGGVFWSGGEILDNTPEDGIGFVAFTDATALTDIPKQNSYQWVDVNWVHHVRYLLTTKKRGGRASTADIGDSFAVEADLAFDEGMFLSVPYSSYGSNMECINDIKRHVDAHVYKSRTTGKWECKSIREDFSTAGIPLFDTSIVSDWSGLERVAASELSNQVTVTYTKRDDPEPGSVTKANVAAVRRVGQVLPGEPIDYPLVTVRALAAQLCARDASVVSVPLLTGTIEVLYIPEDIDIGTTILLNKPDLRINNVLAVVQEVNESDGVSGPSSLKVSEHRFSLGQVVLDNDAVLVPPEAEPADPRVVMEAPYYVLVLNGTQSETDTLLTDIEELGFLLVSAGAPTASHYAGLMGVDSGSGYIEDREISFDPVATLETALTREADDITVTVDLNDTLETVEPNDLASIGSEIVRIDTITPSGASAILTIGRACLDTAPVKHAIGEKIIIWGRGDPSEDRYIQGEGIDVKIITKIPGNALSLADAPADHVDFDARAIRPYPPGQFKVNGSYVDESFYDDVVLTWVPRDRTAQTTLVPEDHDDAGIGPEAGVTYTVRAEAIDADGASLGNVYTSAGITINSHDYPDATAYPGGTAWLDFSVASVRDGFESWQNPTIRVLVNELLVTEDGGDYIETSDGDILATED